MAALIETDGHPPDEQSWLDLVVSLPVGLALATLAPDGQGRTRAANPALLALLRGASGTPPDVLAASTWIDVEEFNRLRSGLREPRGVTDMPARLRRADGTVAHVEITASLGSRESGIGSRDIFLLVRDVGERRRREEQSRDLYQQLLQAEKMAALGQTMSGVAHELNNPLGAILALAERLRLQAARTPLAAGLATLHKEAERAARIARQLLTFARKRHTTRLMVPVNEVVAETVRLREADLQRAGIRVTMHLAADLPDVFADPHQLQQVVLNLLINAEHALMRQDAGGHVQIQTSAKGADSIRIEVADDGPGMSAEVLGRIFDPFFTTKDVGEGTGLGLAVAQAIIAEHGGHIDVTSTPGSGARFAIDLPAAGATVQAPRAQTAPVADTSDRFGLGLRVLLADDEPALAGAVADTLRDAGFEVTMAGDGEEALARARAQTFDAVICDLRMPRVDGPTFYRAIAEYSAPQARRVIFVTGDVTGTEAARFLDDSGCPWLAKPFRLAELLRVVRDVVG
ncbi:ATP-binding protein [Luteitalea sp.]|uniref:hybrid sensor histidine kinase/response regulator n=1 Tax=Luteitalea sp. TaxID=2004800 RepID=UPI000A84B076|nr:ATP-binding protein [Luteitalea sp.]